jgi:uncharacterized coiled-coil DUF342 family protein
MLDLVSDERLTQEILRSIRDEIVGLRKDTNERFGETNQRIDQTNERIDLLAQGQIRLATEVHDQLGALRGELKSEMAELRGEVHELRDEVHEHRGETVKQGRRFEHFLETAGETVRDLQARVKRLEDELFKRS